MSSRKLRHKFAVGLYSGLGVVWPIVSGLLALIAGFGVIVGRIEGWKLSESLYFAFVTGLTIGYGDFSPKTLLGRVLAVVIGILGVLLTALVAAVAVRALTALQPDDES
jgi:Na+-translocating ferredoxin:NAD+ oxidoreductase RnfE subunit